MSTHDFENVMQRRVDAENAKAYMRLNHQEDYNAGVAAVREAMSGFEKGIGFYSLFKWAYKIWGDKRLRYLIWTIETVVIFVFPWKIFIWFLLAGLFVSMSAWVYSRGIFKTLKQTREHFLAGDNVDLDLDTLRKIYQGREENTL